MTKAKTIKAAAIMVHDGAAETDARSIAPVMGAEVQASGNVLRALALNVMAGTVSVDFTDAKARDKFFPRSLKNDKLYLVKLLELDAGALCKAWNAQQEARSRRWPVTLSGLVKAAKEAGLIAKGAAPAKGASEGGDAEELAAALADKIAAILASNLTPAKKLAAITALPDVADACDRLAGE